MNFTIETYELQRIAKILGNVARNTSDKSGKITIQANENNEVVFLAGRDNLGIKIVTNKVSVVEPGLLTVAYGKIRSFIFSFLPWSSDSGTKEFHFITEHEETYIKVTTVYEDGKKSNGKLKLIPDLSYTVPSVSSSNKPNFILNSNIIRDAVNKVLYAIDPTEQRMNVRGVNIVFDDKFIYFAGTNGRVLSEYKVNNVSDLKSGSFVVDYDFISVLKSIITEDTQLFFEIDVDKHDPKIKVNFNGVYYWGSQLIGHTFPDYEELLSKFSNTIIVKKQALTSILHPLMDVLNQDDYHRVTLEIQDNSMSLYNDLGSFQYAGDIEYDGNFIIDMNGTYLNQTVEAIKDEDIQLKFSDEDGLFIFDSNNFENQRALITPVKRR